MSRILKPKVEEWRPVRRFEGVYEISNWGRLRRPVTVRGHHAGDFVRGSLRSDGYINVALAWRVLRRQVLLHQIVAEAFLGPRPAPNMQVNHRHKDGNRARCWSTNLEYLSSGANNADQRRHRPSRYATGAAHPKTKLKADHIPKIRRMIQAGERLQAIADLFGVGYGTIHAVKFGRTHKGVA